MNSKLYKEEPPRETRNPQQASLQPASRPIFFLLFYLMFVRVPDPGVDASAAHFDEEATSYSVRLLRPVDHFAGLGLVHSIPTRILILKLVEGDSLEPCPEEGTLIDYPMGLILPAVLGLEMMMIAFVLDMA